MSIELKVTIKDSERTLTKEFLCYEEIKLVEDDPVIQRYISETMEEFQGDHEEIEDIKIRILMVFK
jgi:hypothetical protein